MIQPKKVVVLDTASLIPAVLRDILLRTALEKLFLVYWSEDIIIEFERTVTQKLNKERSKVDYLIQNMQKNFPYATIPKQQYQHLISQMQNDPKDRHVVAVAVSLNASIIVTPNLKDFPVEVLQPLNIQALSPDEFLERILNESPDAFSQAIQKQVQALKNPPMTLAQVLEALSLHAPKTVFALKEKLSI
jgi:predicted nucleic acid-binding protein